MSAYPARLASAPRWLRGALVMTLLLIAAVLAARLVASRTEVTADENLAAGSAASYASETVATSAASSAAATVEGAPADLAVAEEAIGGSASLVPPLGQRIAQTAELTVRLKTPADLATALDRATAAATRAGGYVVSSSAVARRGSERTTAQVTIRVPAARFATVLSGLSALGTETARTIGSEDLTQDSIDTRARLRNARAVEARLLALLERAATVTDILRVQDRLATVQQEIEMTKGRLDHLDSITSFATITLDLRAPGTRAAAPAKKRHGTDWGIVHALKRGAYLFVRTVNAAIIGLGVLAPFLIATGVIALAIRARRRRQPRPA